jgi:hypothetical protein
MIMKTMTGSSGVLESLQSRHQTATGIINLSRDVWSMNNNCEPAVAGRRHEITPSKSKRPTICRADMHNIPGQGGQGKKRTGERKSAERQEMGNKARIESGPETTL